MIYTRHNALGATVYEVEPVRRLESVVSVDIEAGEVVMHRIPLRLNAAGDAVESYSERFRSIYPIFGNDVTPCLFHCYGRIPTQERP